MRWSFLLLLPFLLVACDDDTAGPEDDSFSVSVIVRDTAGDVVPGLEVRVAAISPELPNNGFFKRRARTVIPLQLPEPGAVQLEIYDNAGRSVRTLFLGLMAAGQHQFSWDGLDNEGAPVLGNQVLRLVMQGWPEGQTESAPEFEDEILMAIWPGPDWDKQILLGQTDDQGRMFTENIDLFPGTLATRVLDLTDETGEVLGTFTVGAQVMLRVHDPVSGDAQFEGPVLVGSGANRFEIVWDPGKIAAPVEKVAPQEALADADIPPIPAQWWLGQNFPNPFN